MSELREIPLEVRDKARVVIQLAETTDIMLVASILAPWVQQDPEMFVQVMLALALMGDADKGLKEAHAAYARGDRTPLVVSLERRYQRLRKIRQRQYDKEREQEEGAA